MKRLSAGTFDLQRRCIAVVNGRAYYREIFKGNQRIFVDPEYPSLRAPQWVYRPGFTSGTNVSTIQYTQF